MSFAELLIIAVGLSMDAFAVAACAGLTMPKVTLKKSLIVGLYFGVFQAAMPIIGFLLATKFADKITTFDHWIAFALLVIIGGKMVYESFEKEGCPDRECPTSSQTDGTMTSGTCDDRECPGGKKPDRSETSLSPKKMLPLAIATSIDALAVGVSFAFLKVQIIPSAVTIGITTLLLSMTGVKIGNLFGTRFKSKAELAGGIILVLMGVKILLEHMGIIAF